MTEAAKLVLEQEITSGNAEGPRNSLKQLSEGVNSVGLGQEWSIYFTKAKMSLDAYACFAWEI
jgi:hypothetical protein